MKKVKSYEDEKLDQLTSSVKSLCKSGDYENCCKIIYEAMSEFPHAAKPHNLLGVVLEKKGNHVLAMKHFRAAWALDPTYRPASANLHIYDTFYSNGTYAYDESDLDSDY